MVATNGDTGNGDGEGEGERGWGIGIGGSKDVARHIGVTLKNANDLRAGKSNRKMPYWVYVNGWDISRTVC